MPQKQNLYKAIQYICEQVDIKQYVIDQYGIEFKKYGSNFRCVCPLHQDTDPSFCITEGKNVFYCFGCKAGGTLIDFVEQYDKVNRTQAIIQILKVLGQDISEYISAVDITSINIMDSANEYFLKNTNHETYKSFIKSKKYNYDYYKQHVGYSVTSYELEQHLLSKGYDQKTIWSHGLVGEKFDNAIVYPIKTILGTISYFSCRLFGDVKYTKNDENCITFIPNLLLGADTIKSGKRVVVVEGNGDYHTLNSYGFNVLSMMGTKFNRDMIEFLLLHDITEVVFWVDGDGGGWKFLSSMYEKYGELFCNNHINAYALYIEGQDPDRYMIDSKDKSDAILNEAELIPIFQLKQKIGDTSNINHVHAVIHDLMKHMVEYDTMTIDTMFNFIANQYKYDVRNLQDKLIEMKTNRQVNFFAERTVLGAVVHNIKLVHEHDISLDCFEYKAHKLIFVEFMNAGSLGLVMNRVPDWCIDTLSDLVNCDYSTFMDNLGELKQLKDVRVLKNIGREILVSNDDAHNMVNTLNNSISRYYRGASVDISNVSKPLKQIVDNIMNKVTLPSIPLSKNWSQINHILGGIRNEKLIMISGNTGHGKTTIALNWLHDMSILGGNKGLMFSGEMNYEELTERLISIGTNVDGGRIQERNLSDDETRRIIDFTTRFNHDNVLLHNTMQFNKIVSFIKYAKYKYNIQYVIIDYLQLIDPPSSTRGQTRTSILKEMTGILKREICLELGLPVIMLSQLGDSALDDPIPTSRKNSETKLALSDCDVTMAMRRKNEKEKALDPNGDIMLNIDKIRYKKDGFLINLKQYSTSLLITEAGGQN